MMMTIMMMMMNELTLMERKVPGLRGHATVTEESRTTVVSAMKTTFH